MADGRVIIDALLDTENIQKGINSINSLAKKGLGVATGAAAAVGTALIGIGTASTMVGMNFEASMSQVAATMGITADEINNGSESFEMLEQAAKDAGATTKFSAGQSAEALNYLALAGYDAETAVKTLPKVLNLAAAGGLDLAYTSDLVTDGMSALGLETKDLDMFVDQLAKTSQKSNTSVGQLGEAVLTVGGTAKNMAGGVTEMNTVLGILADNGIKGAEGRNSSS
ncbi:MAG: phage tail tape measure protein [Culicoidibacterales bacterium]